MRCSALLCLILPTLTTALVPKKFWTQPYPATQTRACSMYFDDLERLQDLEKRLSKPLIGGIFAENSWIISYSDEKKMAMEQFLGYNSKSASKLTDEQVEEETLRWVVDTDMVVSADNDGSFYSIESDMQGAADRQRMTTIKYDSIKDLLIASSCHSTLESLTFLWNVIADSLEDEIESPSLFSSRSSKSVKLIVFSQSEYLWNYDTAVAMLEAIKIAQPLLPTQISLRLDLFHPDYKHSPKMWSPQSHSPFPTVGLTIKTQKQPLVDEMDIDVLRNKLDVLFQLEDATSKDVQSSSEDHSQVLNDCRHWLKSECGREETKHAELRKEEVNIDWIVQNRESPFQLYRVLWNSAQKLSSDHKSTTIIIDPFLDSHTFHRVAVTMNAALKRLSIPVRITQMYHPFRTPSTGNSKYKTRPPHGMIQLSEIRLKNH